MKRVFFYEDLFLSPSLFLLYRRYKNLGYVKIPFIFLLCIVKYFLAFGKSKNIINIV